MFAAHIREADGVTQSVKEHSENTARLACEFAAEAGLSAVAELAGTAHDFGKLCGDFDAYISGAKQFRRGEIDHAYAGAKYICFLAEGFSDSNVKQAAKLAARVIISHHGLHDWVDSEGENYFAERLSKDERYGEITEAVRSEFCEEKLRALLSEAGKEYGELFAKLKALACGASEDKNEQRIMLAFYMGLAERLLESCLVDADRTDTADFMAGKETANEAECGALWEDMTRKLSERLARFSDKTDIISAQRKNISERCARFAEKPVGAIRLIVPTGGGKTLASLRFAIEYCRRNGMKKIIYTAPFMSILEQNSDEIRAVAGEDNFLEHHSNIFAELDGKEELEKQELLAERWTSPVIATTMVQLLNALFSGKMSALRRMHRLCRAVIIVDEIQSLPLKCVYMFNLAVNFLTRVCGAAVVLCSATQPRLENERFPLLLDSDSSMTGDYNEDFRVFKRTSAVPLLKNGGFSFEEAAEICTEKFRENGSKLVKLSIK